MTEDTVNVTDEIMKAEEEGIRIECSRLMERRRKYACAGQYHDYLQCAA